MNRSIWLCGVAAAAATWIYGQEYGGTITGILTDASNALVPNAKVCKSPTFRQPLRFNAETNSTGSYMFSLLEPGTYWLRAEASGFTPLVVSEIEVHAAEKHGLNLRRKLGDITQTVEVTANATLLNTQSADALNTQSADAGTVIDNAPSTNCPCWAARPSFWRR